jgi:hypothetical protein
VRWSIPVEKKKKKEGGGTVIPKRLADQEVNIQYLCDQWSDRIAT